MLQISCAVTAQLISAFFFAIQIVPSLCYLIPKSQASSIFFGCSARFVSDLVENTEDPFSHNKAHISRVKELFHIGIDRELRGRTGTVVRAFDFRPRGPWFEPPPGAIHCGLKQVSFTPCLVLVKPRKGWTDNRLGQTVTRLKTILCLMC